MHGSATAHELLGQLVAKTKAVLVLINEQNPASWHGRGIVVKANLNARALEWSTPHFDSIENGFSKWR